MKTQLLLESEFIHDNNNNNNEGTSFMTKLRSLVQVVIVGVDDKIQQVMFSALALLEGLLHAATR